MKKVLLAVIAALPVMALANPTNLILNGSFEADVQGNKSWNIYKSLTGWTGTAYTGSPRLGIELRNNVAGTAQDGLNFVELDTEKNSAMWQTLTTEIGKKYDLSFWIAQRPNHKGADSNGLAWSIDGSMFNSVGQNTDTAWQLITGSFVATATSTTLTFKAIGTSDSYGTSLDNISVYAATAPVPEPETYALMLAGLGAVGFVARRRQAR